MRVLKEGRCSGLPPQAAKLCVRQWTLLAADVLLDPQIILNATDEALRQLFSKRGLQPPHKALWAGPGSIGIGSDGSSDARRSPGEHPQWQPRFVSMTRAAC